MMRPVLQFNLSLIYKGHIKQTEEVAYLIGTNDDFIRDYGERKEAGRLRIGNLSATTYSEIGSGRISFE